MWVHLEHFFEKATDLTLIRLLGKFLIMGKLLVNLSLKPLFLLSLLEDVCYLFARLRCESSLFFALEG